jgi:hypothetical protein
MPRTHTSPLAIGADPSSGSPLWTLSLVAMAGIVVIVLAVITLTRSRRRLLHAANPERDEHAATEAPAPAAGSGHVIAAAVDPRTANWPAATIWRDPPPDAPVPAPRPAPDLPNGRHPARQVAPQDGRADSAVAARTVHTPGTNGVAEVRTIGPYRLLEVLGRYSWDIGVVWSAVDPDGQPVSVAVLGAAAAGDERWRDEFIVAATVLERQEHEPLPVLSVDFVTPTPWVAVPAGPDVGAARIFLALGLGNGAAAECDGDRLDDGAITP